LQNHFGKSSPGKDRLEKLNIRALHIIQGKHFGGAEQVVLTLTKCFDRSRVTPSVLCLSEGLLFKKLTEIGIHSFLIPMKSRIDIVVPLLKTMKLIRKKQIDIIHTHTVRSNLIGRLASYITARKCVTHVHSPILRDFADLRRGRINELIDRITRPIATQHIAVSHSLRREMIQCGLESNKIVTVHNAVDFETLNQQVDHGHEKNGIRKEYNIQENAFLLVVVALLRPRKGIEVLIKAMNLVLEYFPDVRLLIVGNDDISEDPDYGDRLRRLASELDIEANVFFTGFRNDIPEILSQCNLMVLPALFGEGLPIVILEAMAMGVPVVASKVEGIPEVIVDGENGFLVSPGDSKQLANKIMVIIKDPILLKDFKKKAQRKIYMEMNAHNHAKQIEQIYRKILN
jgi:glycosyltransferase involved in cell wall biosynthesis